jgi:hypothetical protein
LRERIAHVVQHVRDFKPTELALVATAEHGTIGNATFGPTR